MNRIFDKTDLDGMRKFIILQTPHFKTAAGYIFDSHRYAEDYEFCFKMVIRLGGCIV